MGGTPRFMVLLSDSRCKLAVLDNKAVWDGVGVQCIVVANAALAELIGTCKLAALTISVVN